MSNRTAAEAQLDAIIALVQDDVARAAAGNVAPFDKSGLDMLSKTSAIDNALTMMKEALTSQASSLPTADTYMAVTSIQLTRMELLVQSGRMDAKQVIDKLKGLVVRMKTSYDEKRKKLEARAQDKAHAAPRDKAPDAPKRKAPAAPQDDAHRPRKTRDMCGS